MATPGIYNDTNGNGLRRHSGEESAASHCDCFSKVPGAKGRRTAVQIGGVLQCK